LIHAHSFFLLFNFSYQALSSQQASCIIKAKLIAKDEMCDATEDAHGCFFVWLKKIKDFSS
jgi:hypothetical protein